MKELHRGEVWLVDLNPTRGREQKGVRPALVVSHDAYNQGPADLVVVAPITSRDRGIPLHIPVNPPDGGLKNHSAIMCDAVRSISKRRLLKKWGVMSSEVMHDVADRLRILMDL